MKGELLMGIATLVALVALAAAIFLAFSPGELPHNVSHVSAFPWLQEGGTFAGK